MVLRYKDRQTYACMMILSCEPACPSVLSLRLTPFSKIQDQHDQIPDYGTGTEIVRRLVVQLHGVHASANFNCFKSICFPLPLLSEAKYITSVLRIQA
jgi:hypothetical protein